MNTYISRPLSLIILAVAFSCEVIDDNPEKHIADQSSTYLELNEVAELLAAVPIASEQILEVHCAVSSSSENGYDEEYTMKNLFSDPGSGVGDQTTRSGGQSGTPLRALIEDYVRNVGSTKVSSDDFPPGDGMLAAISRMGADGFINALLESDIQIYWPYSELWDGETMPLITFDPEDGAENNIGYRLAMGEDGQRIVEEVIVDEEMAKTSPVWVVNRNSDAGFTSLEMLRREDPDWGEGGGTIVVRPSFSAGDTSAKVGCSTKGEIVRTLLLRDFTMKRNYDSWFAGASEFFVKIGAVEDFTASTEAELRLYNPSVTDFMIVVKRSQVGIPQPFNAILVSEWTDQLGSCAFMITEDDGGTRTSWDCSAVVKIKSKSYGFDVSLPFNSRDDVVWRGQLGAKWLEENSNITGHFGDVDLTFEIETQ